MIVGYITQMIKKKGIAPKKSRLRPLRSKKLCSLAKTDIYIIKSMTTLVL